MTHGIIRSKHLIAIGLVTAATMSCSLFMETPELKEDAAGAGRAGVASAGAGTKASSGLGGASKGGANSSMGQSSTTVIGATSGGATSGGAATTLSDVGNVGQGGVVGASGGFNGQGTAVTTVAVVTPSDGGTAGSVVNTTTMGGIATGNGGATSSVANATIGGVGATGGAATGGVVATGGAATGGAVATGGTSGCGDTQTSPDNCGKCGHGCLGGTCVQGMCQPVAVANGDRSTKSVLLYAIESTYLYYGQGPVGSAPNIQLSRVSKTNRGGAGTALANIGGCGTTWVTTAASVFFTTGPCGSYGVADPLTIYTCAFGVCSSGTSSFDTTARLVPARTTLPYFVTIDQSCDAPICIDWWNDARQSVKKFRDYSTIFSSDRALAEKALVRGDTVYWTQPQYDASDSYQYDVLYSIDRVSLSRAQLAGQMQGTSTVLDANDRSVILTVGTGSSLYRVSLPLGQGNASPTTMGVAGVSATEDSTGFYWMDESGTVSSCSPDNCAGTQKVLANAQTSGNGILTDDKAIYWGRSNPPAVMRLAK